MQLKTVHLDDDSIISGIVQANVDVSLEEAAAFEYLKMSREGVRAHKEKGVIEKFTRPINDHSHFYVQNRDLIPGFVPREWRNRVVWKRDGDQLVIIYEDTTDLDEEISLNGVRGSAQSAWVFERMPHLQDIAQTKVTFVSRVDIAIPLPKFAMNMQARKFAKNLSMMRNKFDKSLEIDKARRKSLVPRIEQMIVGEEGARAAKAQFNKIFMEREGSKEASTRLKLARIRFKVEKSGSMIWGQTR